MLPNPQETADLVTFTEEILNGKLHFLCSARYTEETTNKFIKKHMIMFMFVYFMLRKSS